MAKKYLLYIHDDVAFDKESYKSELVNKLLKDYWSNHTKGNYVAPIEDLPINGVYTNLSPAEKATQFEIGDKTYVFCKHDQIKGLCKKGCK